MALLGLTLAVTAAGWAAYHQIGGEAIADLHEVAANVMLAVVGLHLAGGLFSIWRSHGNLIGAMVTGRKPVPPDQGVGRARWPLAALLLASVLGFWWLQWQA